VLTRSRPQCLVIFGGGWSWNVWLCVFIFKLFVQNKSWLSSECLFGLNYFFIFVWQLSLLQGIKLFLDFLFCNFLVFTSRIELSLEQFSMSKFVLSFVLLCIYGSRIPIRSSLQRFCRFGSTKSFALPSLDLPWRCLRIPA
jgi:hypothetical protein